MVKKTREEIETLKKDWSKDPIWDIENTDGFEAHREELAAYRQQCEQRWVEDRRKRDEAEDARIGGRAQEMECSPAVVRLIEALETKIKTLQDEVAELQEQSPAPSLRR